MMAAPIPRNFAQTSTGSPRQVSGKPEALQRAATTMAPKKSDGRQSYLQPSRKDQKSLLLWMPSDLHKAVKLASVEDELTLQEIGEAALRDWLAKRAKRKG